MTTGYEMSTETLRRAAALMREDVDPRWHAVGDWLEDVAILAPCDDCTSSEARCKTARVNGAVACCPDCAHPSRNALAVARVYLGEQA